MPGTPLRVGDILLGFCAGAFGEHYTTKRVEGIGADWVIVRDVNGDVGVYLGAPEYLTQFRPEG